MGLAVARTMPMLSISAFGMGLAVARTVPPGIFYNRQRAAILAAGDDILKCGYQAWDREKNVTYANSRREIFTRCGGVRGRASSANP